MLNTLIKEYPALDVCKESVEKTAEILLDCFKSGGKLLVCGNGGSCSDSGHIAGELLKGFKSLRPLSDETRAKFVEAMGEDGNYLADNLQGSLPVISLPDQTAVITAFNNDVDPSLAFAQLVLGFARENDVFMGISTSGNSKNVVSAAKVAKALGIKVVCLVGERDCELDKWSDAIIHAPHTDTAHIQEYHLPIYHALCAYIEEMMF